MWEKHCRSSEASGCEGSNILGKQREWQKIFPSTGRKYLRPLEESISVMWKKIFHILWRRIFLFCVRLFYHWRDIFLSCGRKYLVSFEENISSRRKYFCYVEKNICVLWNRLFLFCVSKYICAKREKIIASCGNRTLWSHFGFLQSVRSVSASKIYPLDPVD